MSRSARVLSPVVCAFLATSGVSLGAMGCGGTGSATTGVVPDALDDAVVLIAGSDAAMPDDGGSDAALARVVIPAADPDAAACVGYMNDYPGIVCFGADAAPYVTPLVPDSGFVVGQCPASSDFLAPRGEGPGPCGNRVCGPLLPAAVTSLLDGSVPTDADGGVCCFWALQLCGP
ncbi:MAG: hypothetical protein ACRENE_00440 [Polyangiaceae bacterium]